MPSRKSSRKISRKGSKCKKNVNYIRGYTRKDGVKVKGHCSRKRSRSSYKKSGSRKGSKRSSKKTMKKVSNPRRKSVEKPCKDFYGADCDTVMDKKGMRRCRTNVTTRQCEYLPHQYRKRATYQVGGDATVDRYVKSPGRLSLDRLKRFEPSMGSFSIGF